MAIRAVLRTSMSKQTMLNLSCSVDKQIPTDYHHSDLTLENQLTNKLIITYHKNQTSHFKRAVFDNRWIHLTLLFIANNTRIFTILYSIRCYLLLLPKSGNCSPSGYILTSMVELVSINSEYRNIRHTIIWIPLITINSGIVNVLNKFKELIYYNNRFKQK